MSEPSIEQRLTLLGTHLDAERSARSAEADPRDEPSHHPRDPATQLDHRRSAARTRNASALVAAALLLVGGVLALVNSRSNRTDNDVASIDAVRAETLQPANGANQADPAAAATLSCATNVRVYSAGAPRGSARLATGASFEAMRASGISRVSVLESRETTAWDGDVVWLIGPEAACRDLAELGLPEPSDVISGDISTSLASLGLTDPELDPEAANTVLVVLGTRYVPDANAFPTILGPDGEPAGQAIPVGPTRTLPNETVATAFVTARSEAGVAQPGVLGLVVPVYDEPGGEPRMLVYSNDALGQEVRYPLVNRRRTGEPLVLRVIEGSPGDAWLQVQAPTRPHRQSVWVRASDFVYDTTEKRIEIDIGSANLQYFDGPGLVIESQVVVGRSSRPTTLADTYVDAVIDGPSYSPAVGPYIFSYAVFSDVLGTFGRDQLPLQGIHGTNQPELMGEAVSSGKVRLPNEVIEFLALQDLVGANVVIFDSKRGLESAKETLQSAPWTAARTVAPDAALPIGEPIF